MVLFVTKSSFVGKGPDIIRHATVHTQREVFEQSDPALFFFYSSKNDLVMIEEAFDEIVGHVLVYLVDLGVPMANKELIKSLVLDPQASIHVRIILPHSDNRLL